MTLTKRKIFLVCFIIIVFTIVVLLGVWRYRRMAPTKERVLDQSIQAQEQVRREYIPAKLKEKDADELVRIGINLWGE